MPPSGLPTRVRWYLDGIGFNTGPDQQGREWVIDGDTGWSSSPPIRSGQGQPRHGAHGAWPGSVYRDPRTIRLDGWVYAPTWGARRDAEHRLAALCAEPGGHELRCTEELGDLTATVTQDDTTLVSIRPGGYWLDFSVQLAAADPRKYAVTEQTATTGMASDSAAGLDFGEETSGLDFETGGGLDFGPQLSTGRATATNDGTADTPVVLTLDGPLTAPVRIVRPDLGTTFTYRDPIGTGERLLIDTGRRVVRLGDVSARHRAIVPDWGVLTIPPLSTVDYVLQHGGVANPTARLTVTWRSAWW